MPMDDLIKQADNLPDDFSQHLFDAPLLTRVELDGQYLGDAMILLSRSQTVQMTSFTEIKESKLPAVTRTRWAKALNQPFPLGKCIQSCMQGLQNLHYNLATTTLYISTDAAQKTEQNNQYIELPEGGSTGLVLSNQVNLVGGEIQPWSGYQSFKLEGSLGHWTTVASSQISRSDMAESATQARINSMFVQRELPGHAIRTGLFMPENQGILRQPVMPGRIGTQTLIGIMAGSSNTLIESHRQSSLAPIYVSANRESLVEIYRDGVLINSQPIAAGLQQLDTSVLPDGIYGVEVRVLEDGREISRTDETVYKPNHWQSPGRRWDYNVYGGVEREFGNQKYNEEQGNIALGLSTNYLLTPSVVAGAAIQQSAGDTQLGISSDIQLSETMRFYGSTGYSDGWGSRYDLQLGWQFHPSSSLMVNNSQNWYQPEDSQCALQECQTKRQQYSGITLNHRLDSGASWALRGTSHDTRDSLGVDASYRTRFRVMDTAISLTLSAFDRPYSSEGDQRNRGANLNLAFSLGENKRGVTASLGSRNDSQGGRDLYATLGVSQRFDDSAFKYANLGVTADKYGAAGNVYTDFQSRYASGSLYAQQSTLNQKISGGLNMSNTLAVGDGRVTVSSGAAAQGGQSGMILDVESDDPSVTLKAWDSNGGIHNLKPGRNFVPVSAWKSGQIQIDFEGKDGPAMKIWPTDLPYHLNKGGVAHGKVRVMNTVTVIGRLVDHKGEPVSGAKLVNHAGQGISEHDGFFVADMHEHTPELTIHHRDEKQCLIRLNPALMTRENNTLLVGDLSCEVAGNG